MRKLKITLLISIFAVSVKSAWADYPIMSHSYLADPGAMVYNGRVYVYCSNDNENDEEGYDMTSIVCVSSADLKNWTDHGIVFDVPRDASWSGKSWAPSPVYKDGQFYLYFGNGGSAIGVAVADNPLGPFVDPVGRNIADINTPGVRPFDGWLFDPMTFIDDDGQAYMYFGGDGDDNLRVVRLNDDMISLNGEATRFEVPNFFEAAWVHKHNGTYYFSYSTTPSAGMRIDYMTSDNPMSGFTYGGVLSPQPPNNNNNNHQAIFQLQDQWYEMYHNRIVAARNGDNAANHRNLAIDAFSHNADGSIERMVNTVDGIQQLMHLNPYERVEAETMSEQSGIRTVVSSAGGMNLGYIDNGDWTMVEGVDFGTIGANTFTASVGSPQGGGSIEVRLGSPTGTLIGTLAVPNTGAYQNWESVTTPVNVTTGVHNVYFVFSGGFDIDFWSFEEAAGAPEVSLVTPLEGDTLFTGEDVAIDVEVSDEDGTIANVFYYINNELIQEEWVAPYAFNYIFETAGSYEIRAVATDNDGNKKEDAISVNVYIPQAPYQGNPHLIPGVIQLEEYDVGGNGFAYYDDSKGSETDVDFRLDENVDIEVCTDAGGGYNLGYTKAGEWLEYTVDVETSGLYDLDLRVASDGEGKTLSLTIDNEILASEIAIPNTGGWQEWETITITGLELQAGEQILRVSIGPTSYINLNYLEFHKQTITALENQLSESVYVYPNPFSGGFYVDTPENTSYSLMNLGGQIVKEGKIKQSEIIGKRLKKGVYLLNLKINDHTHTVKVIKN